MAIDFPAAPEINDTFVVGTVTYTWDGTKWTAIFPASLPDGTTTQKGVVQLEDSTSSTSTTKAATPNSVKSAYDLAAAALPKAGGTMTGDITLSAQSNLRFADADSSNWVAFRAPATVASNVTWTLPASDGTANQVLSTNGTGTLSWQTPTAGGVSLGLVIALS
jgi:phage-related tail fiber protein